MDIATNLATNLDNDRPIKRVRWFTCDVCGHTWRSNSLGQRIKCPKCYEARTGKKLGADPERMKEVRSHIKPKHDAFEEPDFEYNPVAARSSGPQENKKGGFLSFLNKEISL